MQRKDGMQAQGTLHLLHVLATLLQAIDFDQPDTLAMKLICLCRTLLLQDALVSQIVFLCGGVRSLLVVVDHWSTYGNLINSTLIWLSMASPALGNDDTVTGPSNESQNGVLDAG